MSSSLRHGLQSLIEPQLVETHISMQKLAAPTSKFSHSLPCPQNPNLSHNQEQELGGWSFIQTITNTSHNSKQGTETDEAYVHPLDKRSKSTLSTKSLEMCTESLGSETGSDISENSNEFASMLMEKQNINRLQRSKPRELTKKVKRVVNFPPPLTSISGSDGFRVRPHREGGRLVIEVVTVSSGSPCFLAERANGRLTLSFSKGNYPNCDNEIVENVENQSRKDGKEHENADKVEDGEGDGDGGCWKDNKKGNGEKVECEVGVGDFPMPRRCKEGENKKNKGIQNWRTFWVAIS